MPIYAYRCAACGHAKDVLQKLSDPLLTTCPACGAEAFSKQVTAAGFQLKGSGWYVTDFKGGGAAAAAPAAPEDGKDAKPADKGAKPAAAPAPAADGTAKPAAAAAAPAPASAPAGPTPTTP
ncbi:MAG: zinc ribbon domain-containing protein [Ideonella sp.]|nr:zinc ribbon domain-containing protein [Ideonella sp.]